jgi:transposase
VTAASVQERDGAMSLRDVLRHHFSRLRVIWADQAYAGDLIAWVWTLRPWRKVRLEIVKRPEGTTGFLLLPKRWIVERTFAWLSRSRRLLRLDAALSDQPPAREPGPLGRPRLNGERRPTLEAVLADEETAWRQLTMAPWYGDAPRAVEVATDTAVWYHAGKPPVPIRRVLMRDPNQRFEPQAWLSTDLNQTPEPVLTWLIRRWTMEVTHEEARAHLGMETQRQWNAQAMARTTPALLSLYAMVTLTAHQLLHKEALVVRTTAWYANVYPTFSEAMARVRQHWWAHRHCSTAPQETDMIQIPCVVFERFIDVVCYAA